MPVALSQIRDLLLPGLWGVSGKYPMIERQWPKVFDQTDSNMALERRVAMRYLGYAMLKQEGAPTAFDNAAGQRFAYNAEHFEIGLGYAITRKAIDDNLYKSEFGPSNDGLMESFKETEETYAAAVFNSGTTFNAAVGLNETSLLNAAIAVRANWVDNAGLKIHARTTKLSVPAALAPIALRLFRSE